MRTPFDTSIIINKARFHAYHGVMPQEQTVGNDYEVSIQIGHDFTHAMQTDDLSHTISYADVYQIISQEMQTPSKLIEHLAGRICKKLFDTYPNITKIDLNIIKKNPPMGADCEGAGVRVIMTNEQKTML